MSVRFLSEQKRHNYGNFFITSCSFFHFFCPIIMCQIISLLLVTPTSYLALILTFKSLLTGKRDEILNLKTRYEMGLGKLEFASNQVCKMNFEKKEKKLINVSAIFF